MKGSFMVSPPPGFLYSFIQGARFIYNVSNRCLFFGWEIRSRLNFSRDYFVYEGL